MIGLYNPNGNKTVVKFEMHSERDESYKLSSSNKNKWQTD